MPKLGQERGMENKKAIEQSQLASNESSVQGWTFKQKKEYQKERQKEILALNKVIVDKLLSVGIDNKGVVGIIANDILENRARNATALILDPEERAEREQEDYQASGAGVRQKFDWLSGNDLTFYHSDLENNPKTKNSYAAEQKEQTQNFREELLKKAEAACSDLT